MQKNLLANQIIEAISDKKGRKISVLDLSSIESAPASKFIICQANSTTQVSSIADNIRETVSDKIKIKPYSYDGYKNSQWIVMDYGEIIVHCFLPEYREFYNLEELWSDASKYEIPDLD